MRASELQVGSGARVSTAAVMRVEAGGLVIDARHASTKAHRPCSPRGCSQGDGVDPGPRIVMMRQKKPDLKFLRSGFTRYYRGEPPCQTRRVRLSTSPATRRAAEPRLRSNQFLTRHWEPGSPEREEPLREQPRERLRHPSNHRCNRRRCSRCNDHGNACDHGSARDRGSACDRGNDEHGSRRSHRHRNHRRPHTSSRCNHGDAPSPSSRRPTGPFRQPRQ